jgi:small-conductance mechanosensitive channel
MELENPKSAASTDSTSTDAFYAAAADRIHTFMIGLGLLLTALAWWRFGHWTALGFAAGSVIAYLNFHWLKSGVTGLADRITNTGQSQSSRGIIARFLVRYVLMGVAAYAILTGFPASLGGLFVGLFLPVGAIACEAAYEMYGVLARKDEQIGKDNERRPGARS